MGGLADTVVDYLPGRSAATGFVFDDYAPAALLQALRRALAVFQDQRQWRTLQLTGMALDHSWDRSAREYVRIYDGAIAQGRP